MKPPKETRDYSVKACWICQGDDFELAKPSNLPSSLNSRDFSVTCREYGISAEISRCRCCGFLQCFSAPETLPYYEAMEDASYEEGRRVRASQMDRILSKVLQYKSGGSLLDVGAGSGILVEAALKAGFKAQGIEPSRWFQQEAARMGLPVNLGAFPSESLKGPYDVITLIDIIEHVSNPLGLLKSVGNLLNEDGIGLVITPDISSLVARVMGWKWWHVRTAHICYFSKKTLSLALEKAGLIPLWQGRAAWRFSGDYLAERALGYLKKGLKAQMPPFLKRMTIPLNLGDSMMVVFTRKGASS